MALNGQYTICQTSRITIHSGKSTQQTVKGLQTIGLPLGATASTVTVSDIGTRIAIKVATGLEYENISASYYFVKGDPTQQYLMESSRAGTVIQDMWFWLDADDFVALDKVNDSAGGMMVGTFSSPTAQKNEVFTGNCELVVSGSYIFFGTHAKASTAVFGLTAGSTGVEATVTSSDTTNYSFVDLGFEVDQVVIIHGVTGNLDTVYYGQVSAVAADVLTLVADVGDNNSIPVTAAASSIQVHAATPIEVSDTY